jgi:tryptophanyl-tRNA synthetase
MRPTGRLHIGNYFGALQNWVKLQNDPQNECFYFIADWHSLTSDYADTSAIAENTIQVAIDFLAGGLDPAKSTIFLQSLVPEHAELNLLLSMVTPLGWLERVPTYKEALANVKDKDLHTYGFLGYPVLQCGDIVMYGAPKTELFVPVGEDQVSHVELSREIVRRFNFHCGIELDHKLFDDGNEDAYERATRKICAELKQPWPGMSPSIIEVRLLESYTSAYAKAIGFDNFHAQMGTDAKFFRPNPVLCEPEVLLTQTPRIPGTDGRKMSKSYGNDISLSESDESIRAKTKVMITDPARKRRENPGNPDICPVYDWHKLFSPQQTLEWAAQGCRTAGIGCIECKTAMADHLIKWIAPVRAKRQEYEKHPQEVLRVLDEGSKKARKVAQQTMARVREAVFGWEKKRAEIAGATADAKNVKVGK